MNAVYHCCQHMLYTRMPNIKNDLYFSNVLSCISVCVPIAHTISLVMAIIASISGEIHSIKCRDCRVVIKCRQHSPSMFVVAFNSEADTERLIMFSTQYTGNVRHWLQNQRPNRIALGGLKIKAKSTTYLCHTEKVLSCMMKMLW